MIETTGYLQTENSKSDTADTHISEQMNLEAAFHSLTEFLNQNDMSTTYQFVCYDSDINNWIAEIVNSVGEVITLDPGTGNTAFLFAESSTRLNALQILFSKVDNCWYDSNPISVNVPQIQNTPENINYKATGTISADSTQREVKELEKCSQEEDEYANFLYELGPDIICYYPSDKCLEVAKAEKEEALSAKKAEVTYRNY